MNPTLGLVVALAVEAHSLFGRRHWHRIDQWQIHYRDLDDGTRLICICSGMGMDNAFSAALWLIDQGVTALAIMGVAGGLDPALKAGDMVLADMVFEDREKKDPIWNTDPICTELALEVLAARGIPIKRGSIITTRDAVITVDGKKTLHKQSRALAVDMESAAVARAAGQAGLPFFVLRAICDAANQSVSGDLFHSLDANGKVQLPILLGKILRRPFLIVELLRMRKLFVAALNTLKKGWRALVVTNNWVETLASRQQDAPNPKGRDL